jgi:hypothetical protein
MKTAEILRNIISLLDAEEQQAQQQPVVININNGEMVDQETAPEDTVDDDAIGVMVPPLQQKIELIKKSEGVKSVYDTQEDDELATLKKHAGLNTAVIADEDEPFEG